VPLVLVWACTPAEEAPQQQTRRASSLVGKLENQNIDEASGLARSQDDPNRYWVINDGGPAALYAIDNTGKELGRVKLSGASNKDWEDVASFRLQGKPYLLVADIGDNKASREDVRLYVVEEPDPGQSRAKPSRRIDFEYPEGPRDAEAVAVDDENARALILTKNDIPALLYSVSLAPAAKSAQTAMRLGAIGSLPQPSRRDVQFAPKTDNWYWQPTAMDISADGSAAIILTYGGVFLYRREPGEDWLDALQRQPRIISRTRNPKAESVAFNAASDAIYITIEQRNAPLFRLDLGAAPDQRAPTQGEPEQ
jgi:hypothetical protein